MTLLECRIAVIIEIGLADGAEDVRAERVDFAVGIRAVFPILIENKITQSGSLE